MNSLSLTDDGKVLYNSDDPIYGFQFNVDGATIVSVDDEGDAGEAGFNLTTGSNTVLGVSFSLGSIPAGCGTLVTLDVTGDPTGLSSIIVSDATANPLSFEYYEGGGSPDVAGCTDSTACNYNMEATVDDGSCTFAEENYDCLL